MTKLIPTEVKVFYPSFPIGFFRLPRTIHVEDRGTYFLQITYSIMTVYASYVSPKGEVLDLTDIPLPDQRRLLGTGISELQAAYDLYKRYKAVTQYLSKL